MGSLSADKAGHRVGGQRHHPRSSAAPSASPIIGSVFSSVYSSALVGKPGWDQVPPEALERAEDGIGLALGVAGQVGGDATAVLTDGALQSFMDGLQAGCLVASGVTLVGSLMALALLPARPALVHDIV